MPIQLDRDVRRLGTKFLLFPQAPYLAGYSDPERVWVSPPAGTIGPGPSDDRMYVVDAVDKPDPYDYPNLPPYFGISHPAVEPDADGHFDSLRPGTRAFVAAHAFGSLRRVLDIWEGYLGHDVSWFFASDYRRLEIIPMIKWHNAQSGYGFMEFGYHETEAGEVHPHALNFDVIAHELGHAIMFSEMGVPEPERRTSQFYGFHEACADLTALFSMLHFDSVADRLLRSTRGNLYVLNELNRIAELSDTKQIRIASNARKLSEVSTEVHDLSRPFTGAVFDIMVDVFLDVLLRRGLITPSMANNSFEGSRDEQDLGRVQAAFDAAYRNRHFAFKTALFEARDLVGEWLAFAWQHLAVENLEYQQVAMALLEADTVVGGGYHERAIRESFEWREILEKPALVANVRQLR